MNVNTFLSGVGFITLVVLGVLLFGWCVNTAFAWADKIEKHQDVQAKMSRIKESAH